jgi:Fe-S cluster biogenesis protein NfuA
VSCGADCSEAYASGTVVTLTATASSNSVFTGWSGACAGTGACTVTMSATRSVTASFTRTFALTVTRNGTATGTVTSVPAGVTCGTDCTERYVSGTVVALTPTAAAGAVFAGWSGACSGAGACSVTMTADRSVTATFDAAPVPQFTLTVATAGTGAGSVTAPGIACPGDCSQTYNSGTAVALTVTPAAGAVFAGWSGACSGAGACSVDMTADRSVTATFTAQPTGTTYPLTVTRDGTGGGPVTSVPAGVSCGADCTEAYPAGTVVTLGAAPVAGSVFSGWLGACTGTGPCTVTMSASRAVTATFTAQTTGAPRFTADAVAAMPNPAPRGASTTVTVTVTNTGGPGTGLLVDFEIYNAAGAKIHQQITTGQSFQSGERRTFRWVWPVPGTLAPGIYTIKLGFFAGNWATLYTWINAAGSIFVP